MQITRVKLSAEHQKLFRDLKAKEIGLQHFVQYTVAEGQRRGTELAELSRQGFERVAAELGLDLTTVEYVLSDDGTELVPRGVRL